MQRCWARYGPPTYRAVALYLGLAKPPAAAETLDTPEAVAAFLGALPSGRRSP